VKTNVIMNNNVYWTAGQIFPIAWLVVLKKKELLAKIGGGKTIRSMGVSYSNF
jgi:hypothetical protein